jgi:GLPGLI family protein
MKKSKNFMLLMMLMSVSVAMAQKQYNEGMIQYNIVVVTGSKEAKTADFLDGATLKMYFKNQLSKSEMKSILGTTTVLHDSRSGNASQINEYGEDKVLIRMSKKDYEEANQKYSGIKYEYKNETRQILGYTAKLAVITLRDGSSFRVYYTTDFSFQNKNYGPQFAGLPGVPLEYEAVLGDMKVTYIADKISFDPIVAVLFDLPKSGYREMSYEEIKKLQKKN